MQNRKIKNEELDRKTAEEFKNASKTPLIAVLDNVRSLHNVGSVFRTADAFLIEAVYLCGITGCPPNKEIQKSALGATETVNWKYFKTTQEALEELSHLGYQTWAIEQVQGSISLENFEIKKTEKYALIFGNEVNGVDQDVVNQCKGSIEIPQAGTKHSLNVSISSGILLWDFFKVLRG